MGKILVLNVRYSIFLFKSRGREFVELESFQKFIESWKEFRIRKK